MNCTICDGEHDANACPESNRRLNQIPFLWYKEFHWTNPGESHITSPIRFTIGENNVYHFLPI